MSRLSARNRVAASGYRRILLPSRLDSREEPALTLAWQLAAVYGSAVTLLHVLPPLDHPNSVHWLDAIDQLQRRLSRGNPATAQARVEDVRARACAFLARTVPSELRSTVDAGVECRVGDVATEIARRADELRADCVVVTGSRPRWGLSFRPSLLRRVLRLTSQPVLLVHPARGEPAGIGTYLRRLTEPQVDEALAPGLAEQR